jgi:predicted nucleic acid-binding protein
VTKPTAYIETSIVSYLVGWLNRDSLLVASNQALTREWWSSRRNHFEMFASGVVVDEAGKGDRKRAAERLSFLQELQLLEVATEARFLAARLLRETRIPPKAEIDALHIAVATVGGMDYLVTWNCTHIANGVILPLVYDICRDAGYEPPFVCTPQELMEI